METPPPTLTPHTDKAIEGAGNTLTQDLSAFNTRMNRMVDPGQFATSDFWMKPLRDEQPFPGVYDPLIHPSRVVGGETDLPNPYPFPGYGGSHKASNFEAATLNLLGGFASGISSARGIASFLPPLFMYETAKSVPELWHTVREADKTAPWSQERMEAGLAVVATLVTAGILKKPAVNTYRRTLQIINKNMVPPPNRIRVGPNQLNQISPETEPIVQYGPEGKISVRPGFRRAEPEKKSDEEVGPVIEQEVPSAEQQSVPQVQAGETAQRVEEGAGGEGQGPGDSNLPVGTAEGEGAGGKVPPVKPPSTVSIKPEEKKQEPVEAKPVEDLTDAELDAAIEKATAAFDAGQAGSSEVFDLMREQYRRRKKAEPSPEPSAAVAPSVVPKREKPTEEQVKIAGQINALQGEASYLQNELAGYMKKPVTDETHAIQEKLWSVFNEIHRLREQSGQPRDIVIIGGGAGGLKAAGQAAYEGMDVVVLEKGTTPGGQARHSLEIVNTGQEQFGITGRDYFRAKELTALNRGADIRPGVTVTDLRPRADGGVDVITSTGGVIPARRVAIMTGAKVELHPGFEYAGWGNAERLARETKGKVGMVYGAGNSATQAVLGAIRRGAKKIYLLSRKPFGPEASADQVSRIRELARGKGAKVDIVTAEIKNVEPNPTGGFTVTASNGKKYQVAHLENFLDTSFNTEWIPQSIERAPGPPARPGRKPKPGQIQVTDNSMQTNMPGVYVGGDIRASLPGEDRPRRIDMAEGDATGIATRMVRDVLQERKTGEFPTWRGETPAEAELIDTRLKELKNAEHPVTGFEKQHGDATPNSDLPPPIITAPTAPFREPKPEARFFPGRPGFEGPLKEGIRPETKRKVKEGAQAVAKHAAEKAASDSTVSAQQQQQNKRVRPVLYSPELMEKQEPPKQKSLPVSAQATAKVAANSDYPDMILKKLAGHEMTSVDKVDSTVLLRERALKQGEMNAAGKLAMDRNLTAGERQEAMANFTDADNHLRLMDEVTDDGRLLTGEEARAWHDYRMKDYTKPAMEQKLEIAQGGAPLTAPQAGKVESLTTKLADTTAQIEAMKRRIGFGTGKTLLPSHRQALRDLQYEAHEAKTKLDGMIFDARFKQRSAMYQYYQRTLQTLDFSRAVMTSADLSAVLRQGGLIARGHPIMALKEMPDMLRAAKSDKAYFELMQDIRERPNAEMYISSGLGLTDVKSPVFARMEEAYGSQWADQWPIVGHSQRAYTYFLNRMRADMFDQMAASLPRNGIPTPAQAHAISTFINEFTGRGRTPQSLAGAMQAMNAAFFAPRWTISRFQVLYGDPFWVARNAPGVRSMIAKEYARTLMGYMAEYTLAYYALKPLGVTIEWDPRSTDFGSIKIGDSRWNPMSGLTQPMVFVSRLGAAALESQGLISGSYKDPQGRIKSLRGAKYGEKNVGDVISEFARSKLAPMPSMVWNGLQGERIGGEKTTWTKELLSLMYPITFRDIGQAIGAFGFPVGLALATMAFFGDSVNTYSTKPSGVKVKKPHPKGRKKEF